MCWLPELPAWFAGICSRQCITSLFFVHPVCRFCCCSPPLLQFTSVAPALATLFDACRTQPLALTLILRLAGDVVEHQAAFLASADASALCSWSLRLLQLYSAHNLGQVSVAASRALAAEALADRYLDLRALLKLLTKLTQADWADGGGGGNGGSGGEGAAAQVDVAQVSQVPGAVGLWKQRT